MNRTHGTVLAVTSSTAVVGVAIANAHGIIAARQVATDRRHAEELTPMMRTVLDAAGLAVADIDVFAVDIGPGRFTGLRVGIATVRTLALAVGAQVVGISSLELLAADQPGPVTAVVDARRNEVFQQRFVDGVADSAPMVGPAMDLAARVPDGDIVLGDGADRYGEHYGRNEIVPGREPAATTLASLAFGRPAVPGRDVVPMYLRDADVKINIKTRHNS